MKRNSVLARRIAPLVLPIILLVALISGDCLGQRPVLAGSPTNRQLEDTARAYVIVQFGQQDLTVLPITFTAPISGLRALELTGLEVVTSTTAFGTAVCSIGGVGCSADECFCSSNYWGYNYWDGNDWQGYMVGADASTISDGAVEGWRWGPFGESALYPELPPAKPLLAAASALDWLRSQQSAVDGGYDSMGASVETLLAIGANNLRATGWKRQAGSPSLQSYVMSKGAAHSRTGADAAGKLAVGLSAAGSCWPLGALRPTDFYSPTTGAFTGAYGVGCGSQSWAILGTLALDQAVPEAALEYLRDAQLSNGGWEWQTGFGADTNSTSLALQALIAGGEPITSSLVVSALNYLKSAQNDDGGFTYDPTSSWGTASDTNSTAYVVQALLAAGQDPTSSDWTVAGNNPISFLLSMQLPDGSFEYQPGQGSNLLATQQAVPALLGRPFPLKETDLAVCHGVFLPVLYR